tara:strand:+ start:992 stop:1267 length:276 start_codon:yes stop_codon:yes gene_type:complete
LIWCTFAVYVLIRHSITIVVEAIALFLLGLPCSAAYPLGAETHLYPSFTRCFALSHQIFICQFIAVVIGAVTLLLRQFSAEIASVPLTFVD